MLLDRRSFLIAAPAVALGARTIARAQGIVERGRFGPDDLPLVRERLLHLVNEGRLAANVAPLELDDFACRIANEHALDMAKGKFLSHWGATDVILITLFTGRGTDGVQIMSRRGKYRSHTNSRHRDLHDRT